MDKREADGRGTDFPLHKVFSGIPVGILEEIALVELLLANVPGGVVLQRRIDTPQQHGHDLALEIRSYPAQENAPDDQSGDQSANQYDDPQEDIFGQE